MRCICRCMKAVCDMAGWRSWEASSCKDRVAWQHVLSKRSTREVFACFWWTVMRLHCVALALFSAKGQMDLQEAQNTQLEMPAHLTRWRGEGSLDLWIWANSAPGAISSHWPQFPPSSCRSSEATTQQNPTGRVSQQLAHWSAALWRGERKHWCEVWNHDKCGRMGGRIVHYK